MSDLILIDDFPDGHGGSELVNATVAKHFNAKVLKSDKITQLNKDDFYIISNISLISNSAVCKALSQLNYIILEHDYKICASRHPWRYEDCIVPEADRICYDLYKNAKAVFVQTSDHLDVFKKNDVPGNFISLGSSIWSDEDLDLLESIVLESEGKNRGWQYGIVESDNWIKNSVGAIDFCEEQNLNYELIPASNDRKEFLTNMSKYSTLAFFPIARESCCRLVVEARCLNMNVLTTKNYGAVLEPWFALHGIELINFLKKSTSANLEKMKEYLWK